MTIFPLHSIFWTVYEVHILPFFTEKGIRYVCEAHPHRWALPRSGIATCVFVQPQQILPVSKEIYSEYDILHQQRCVRSWVQNAHSRLQCTRMAVASHPSPHSAFSVLFISAMPVGVRRSHCSTNVQPGPEGPCSGAYALESPRIFLTLFRPQRTIPPHLSPSVLCKT